MHKILAIIVAFLFTAPANTQEVNIRSAIESGIVQWENWKIHDRVGVIEFYETFQYKSTWVGNQNRNNLDFLYQLIKDARYFGLNTNDYHPDLFRKLSDAFQHISLTDDALATEIKLTDAAIHYFSDIAFGNTRPALSYHGIIYTPNCISVPWQLAKHIEYQSLDKLITVLQPPTPEIRPLLLLLGKWIQRNDDPVLKEEFITSTKAHPDNRPLIKKLYCLGILDSLNSKLTVHDLRNKVKEAQRLFGVLNDGIIRKAFLQQLNISLASRIEQCNLSVNYYRWLYCLSRQQQTIVVNIPAAWLQVYHEGRVTLDMKIVVGKTSTPTPTLSSMINEVILYPYWTVPYSIATKELLPAIQRNPVYLEANNFQVLNSNGKVVDPSTIKWSSLSPGYFPYTIRQSTGCDNSLGLLKLNFYNPYSVYLHDTPLKSYFMLNKRFFSHGCMRLERPMDLGDLVLGNNSVAIDTISEKKCLLNQSPIVVPVEQPLPVIVWYNPLGLDASGKPVIYEDMYKKFPWLRKAGMTTIPHLLTAINFYR